jgi:hypothetical protein
MLVGNLIRWLDNAGQVCLVSFIVFCVIAWLILRPLGWRRFFGRCPLLIVSAGAFFFIAVAELPAAFPTQFRWYLGHSVHDMVRTDANTSERWTIFWGERCGTVFHYMIVGSIIWAIINLIRGDSPVSNAFAFMLSVGWLYLYLFAIASRLPF